MTANVDIVNLGLQAIGSRTTVTAAELAALSTNEAIQANLLLEKLRDELLRMAPWNCANNFATLTYITSLPGTPENTTAATQQWQKGQPAPPWNYEYQYPVDCLRALWVVPQFSTGWASGIPITTAVTGGSPSYWNGPPARFKISLDQFFAVTAATVAAGGTGYAVGDLITLAGTPAGSAPIGAPAVLQVATLTGSAVATVTPVTNVLGTTLAGSYFNRPTNPVAQGSTTGSGTGATFNLTLSSKGDQRVILTNQEDAILCYNKQVTDPNVMDGEFVQAWSLILGARLAIPLTGDKGLANLKIQEANAKIIQARIGDGNEGLTINDVTPDWIRIRGVDYASDYGFSPNAGFDWGQLFPLY